jgi:hypothetical protein
VPLASATLQLRTQADHVCETLFYVLDISQWTESRHPVILGVKCHRQNSIQLVFPYFLELEVSYSKSITWACRAFGTMWKAEGGETNMRKGNPVPIADFDANTNKIRKVVVACSYNFCTFSTSLNSLIQLNSKITIFWRSNFSGKNKHSCLHIKCPM